MRGRGVWLRGGDVLSVLDHRSLLHDWPVRERLRSLDQGCVIECDGASLAEQAAREVLGHHSAGWWECDLRDNRLTWTSGVYRIFGFPEASPVRRDDAVALYSEDSRAVMEHLRSYAIGQAQGFGLDARIRSVNGEERWMRLLGAPVVADGRVVRLEGLKLLI